MSTQPTPPADTPQGLNVRSYNEQDQQAVAQLYADGLLAGQIAPNDSGADLDYIQQAYFDDDRHHFWVAQHEDQILGMIGVASDEEHTAEIRRLRVAGRVPRHRHRSRPFGNRDRALQAPQLPQDPPRHAL